MAPERKVAFVNTEIPAVKVVETKSFGDGRGHFREAYNRREWAEAGFHNVFVQDNISVSAKGVLRGMHYQLAPHGIGKLVRVLHGAVYDVAVDLRRGAPTYGRWVGRELSAANGLALWVPEGFAHGLLALEDDTLVYYKCTGFYAPQAERVIHYADPDVGIEWPAAPAHVNPRDEKAPTLDAAEHNFTFEEA